MALKLMSLLALALLPLSSAIFFDLHANEEQCFFESVIAGTTIGLTFNVTKGGNLDINVKITGPPNNNIYNYERKSSGKHTVMAWMNGTYTYCFGNQMSTTPKTVMFSVDVKTPSDRLGIREEV